MTTVKLAASLLLLFSLCLLTGCGMTQDPKQPVATTAPPASTPPPPSTPPPTTPPPPTPPPPSFPTQFIYIADSSAFAIRGFKINADGSLTAVSGSPFAAPGVSYAKAVGTSLIAESGIKLYSVDSSTGAIQLKASLGDFPGVIVPDILPTVFHTNDQLARHFPSLDTYSFAGGFPSIIQSFFVSFPDTTDVLATDPTGNFFYGAHHSARDIGTGPYDLAVITRKPDGTLDKMVNPAGTRLCPDVFELSGQALFAKGNHTFLYHACGSAGQLGYNEIDNSNGSVLNSGNAPTVFGVPSTSLARTETMTVDPSGSFLLMINSNAASLDIFTIDPNTGAPGPTINRFQTGDTPRSVLVDATGQYVYLLTSRCGLALFPSCDDQSTIHAYRMIGGNLTPLPVQSYPAGAASRSLTVVKF